MTHIKEYYIVSLKHTSKGDTALTFWGANRSGYTWNRDRVGLYSKEEALMIQTDDNVPVLKESIDQFWMNAKDFGDEYISCPNNKTVLQVCGLSEKYMKAKKFYTCKMVFTNLLVSNQTHVSSAPLADAQN